MSHRGWVVAAASAAAAVAVPPLVVRRRQRGPDPFADDPVVIPPDVTVHRLAVADGGELHAVERGPASARPLVLLHGITLGAEMWGYQLRDLAGPFRVVAPDLRGHGASTAGTDGYGLGPIAADLVAVLEELDLRDAVVVGHSMGGMALQRAVADHLDVLRDRVAGLVLLSSSPGITLPPAAQRAADAFARRAVGFGRSPVWRVAGSLPPGAAGTLAAGLAFGRAPAASHVAATERWLRAMDPDASWQSGLSMASHAGPDALRAWSGPALVVTGTRDLLTPPRLARRMAAVLPDAHLELVDGAGHMVMLERPDELARLIAAFAARLPVPAAVP